MKIEFFADLCKFDYSCVTACPYGLLSMWKEGDTIKLELEKAYLCTECYQCLSVCRPEALRFDSYYE